MTVQVSQRLESLPVSATRKLLPYAIEAKEKGVNIFHLNVGDPDIPTPEALLNVLRNWNINPIRYSPSTGEPVFIESLLRYYHSLGFKNLRNENLIATVGGSEAIAMALFSTTNPGEEILVFEPLYSGYLPWAAMYGVKLIPVPTQISDGFHLPSKSTIEKRISSKTRAILVCSPGNPTGTVYTKQEVELLISVCKKHGLFFISDEVYREFVFVDRRHISLLEYLEEIPEQAIVIDSLSKRYSLCGARLGVFISGNRTLIQGVTRMAQARLSGGFIDQMVAAASSQVPLSYTKKILQEYKARRDLLYKELTLIPGVSVYQPEGAFYCMVGLPVPDAEKFCRWLLSDYRSNNETVMFAPGSGFYLTPGKGKNEVRIAYVLDTEKLQRCVEILHDALQTVSR